MLPLVPGHFEPLHIKNIHINKNSVEAQINKILARNPVCSLENINAWLIKAITVIDLTTLAGDDTKSNVTRLCIKAANPLDSNMTKELETKDKIHTAAVCVYPSRVRDVCEVLTRLKMTGKIEVAAVSTGFPSGLYPLQTRLQETKIAVADGATEIDVVIDRSLVLSGKWTTLFDEIVAMKKACYGAHLKVILGVGELGSYENVYKASMVAMMAGADFIKTSTGKEAVNATLPIGLIMCRAIRNFYLLSGIKVGLKPAGGLKTARDAINWLVLIHNELGPEWLTPKLFRIGASSLLDDIENVLRQNLTDLQSKMP